ncbi:MAG: SpoIIE family protein phosphatase [Candidatus Kapabacteria bacterium]|nr:SpoIIE family protein phosphatase [Candidatus Kapabacteria bacterium]
MTQDRTFIQNLFKTDTPKGESQSLRPALWLAVSVVMLLAHTVMDVIGTVSDSFRTHTAAQLTTDIFSVLALGSYFFFWRNYVLSNPYTSRDDIFRDMRRLMFMTLPLFLPLGSSELPSFFLFAVTDNIIEAYACIVLFFAGGFVYNLLMYQRTLRTNSYLRALGAGLVFAFVFVAIAERNNTEENPEATVILVLLGIILSILLIIAIKRRTWIHSLSYKEKKRLLLLSFLLVLVSTAAMVMCFVRDTYLCKSYNEFIHPLNILAGFLFLAIEICCERIFWTTLFSLPNTSVIERRTFEFSSVAYLNRIAAESTDIEKLYDTVTQLSQQATRATGAWCEVLKADSEELRIAAMNSLTEKQIVALHDRHVLHDIARNLQEPLLIQSLEEFTPLAFLSRSVESYVKSLIIAPLRDSGNFVGAVYVVNTTSFAFENEDVRALAAFVSSASVAIENARLVEDSLTKERYQRELIVGRQIQRKLLPQHDPVVTGYDICAFSDPALEVGGDYFDYFTLKNGRTVVVIADVSGKGISAAFYMAKLKGVCLALSHVVESLTEFVEQINATLFGSMERQMYITLSAVMLGDDGTVRIVRAGHTPALVSTRGDVRIEKPSGLGIGLAKPAFFTTCIKEATVQLDEGDSILLFTDGVNESRSPDGIELGMEELCTVYATVLQNNSAPKQVIDTLSSRLRSFSLHTLQHDDMTVIAIRRSLAGSSGQKTETVTHEERNLGHG